MKTEEKTTIREENRFHQHRAEIAKISRKQNVDVNTAAAMWAYAMAQTDYAAELKEFDRYVADLQSRTTEKKNLVQAYLEGGDAK